MSATPIQTRRLTLAEATSLPVDQWEDFRAGALDLSTEDRRRTAALWLWLCGVTDPASREAALVGNEVLSDESLIVALNLPALEFFTWFRRQAWCDFDSTERTGSEAWAGAALQRAWGACEAMGALAARCPMAVPI